MRKPLSLLFAAVVFAAVSTALSQTLTDPPASQHVILTVTGVGQQIYTCQMTGDTLQWVLQAPEATLVDAAGQKVGTHGAGPVWRSIDGSEVKGEVLQKTAASDAHSIPWLLLKAVSHSGSGVMSRVDYIRRSDTEGGAPPSASCNVNHPEGESRMPYRATYTFYSGRP